MLITSANAYFILRVHITIPPDTIFPVALCLTRLAPSAWFVWFNKKGIDFHEKYALAKKRTMDFHEKVTSVWFNKKKVHIKAKNYYRKKIEEN